MTHSEREVCAEIPSSLILWKFHSVLLCSSCMQKTSLTMIILAFLFSLLVIPIMILPYSFYHIKDASGFVNYYMS